jgi:signal transduction histidine kinase
VPARSSRKRGRRARAATSAGAGTPPPVSRSEERNAAVRATLTPLAPGERPWPLQVAVAIAILIGIADIVQVAVGSTVTFGHTLTSVAGVFLFSVIMFVCAWGMWRQRYWALLGFQALLALLVVAFTLVLVTATDILRGVVAIAVIAAGGTLFFKLVRVLSRMQLPSARRPS